MGNTPAIGASPVSHASSLGCLVLPGQKHRPKHRQLEPAEPTLPDRRASATSRSSGQLADSSPFATEISAAAHGRSADHRDRPALSAARSTGAAIRSGVVFPARSGGVCKPASSPTRAIARMGRRRARRRFRLGPSATAAPRLSTYPEITNDGPPDAYSGLPFSPPARDRSAARRTVALLCPPVDCENDARNGQNLFDRTPHTSPGDRIRGRRRVCTSEESFRA